MKEGSPANKTRSLALWLGASAALHLAIIAALLVFGPARKDQVQIVPIELLYSPTPQQGEGVEPAEATAPDIVPVPGVTRETAPLARPAPRSGPLAAIWGEVCDTLDIFQLWAFGMPDCPKTEFSRARDAAAAAAARAERLRQLDLLARKNKWVPPPPPPVAGMGLAPSALPDPMGLTTGIPPSISLGRSTSASTPIAPRADDRAYREDVPLADEPPSKPAKSKSGADQLEVEGVRRR